MPTLGADCRSPITTGHWKFFAIHTHKTIMNMKGLPSYSHFLSCFYLEVFLKCKATIKQLSTAFIFNDSQGRM